MKTNRQSARGKSGIGVLIAAVAMLFASGRIAGADPRSGSSASGEKLFTERCAMCHQPNGAGVPPVYPPLAGSEWIEQKREKVIRALAEGLSGPIDVAGRHFDNMMPAQMLDDAEAADVLTFVASSWGNHGPAFTSDEVKDARAKSRFPTYHALLESAEYRPLPAAPAGFTLTEAARLPEFITRLASDADHRNIYALAQGGTIYQVDLAVGALTPIIRAPDYLDLGGGDLVTMGMAVDKAGRLWVVSNQKRIESVPHQNEVTIWRSSEMADGHPAKLQPWFRTRYPYGVGPYNHGVSQIAFGPDGFLYVNSGSRTDGGETGNDPQRYQGGEVDITACLWRFDPAAEKPRLEIHARGIRNAYGFAWDSGGRLFAFVNGPDFNAPEPMYLIEPGKHYGFPFQFSDWPAQPGFPYAHTPPAPPGLQFTMPVVNLGPAGGGTSAGIATFDAHSSPGGVMWCGDEYPPALRGSFLMTRFGNLLGAPAVPDDVGFDLLSVRVSRLADGRLTARVHTVLAPLARPLDVLGLKGGSVLILEYTRPTDFKNKVGWLPGRLLKLSPFP